MTRRKLTTLAPLFLAGVLCGTAFSGSALAQDYRYSPEHRRPVEATLRDLRAIQGEGRFDGHQRERIDNAIHHLEEFGGRLHEGGHFDKDKLDQAIGDVQSVLDHNRLDGRARDVLMRDVADLRDLRQHYDDRRRYH